MWSVWRQTFTAFGCFSPDRLIIDQPTIEALTEAMFRAELAHHTTYTEPLALSSANGLVSPHVPQAPDDLLLKPAEVAEILGVRTATVGFWARTGVLKAAVRTPGGHRRYRHADVMALREADDLAAEPTRVEQDVVRLYEQGWPIRRVAKEFDFSYGRTRRILLRHSTLRSR